MRDILLRSWTPLSLLLILMLLAGAVFLPTRANAIATVVVILSLSIAAYAVVQKHIRLQQSRPAGKIIMARNILVEFTGILLAMLLAGVLGKYAAEILTHQFGDGLTKLIMGIVTGALIGLAVGMLVRRAWGRLMGSF